MGNTRNTGYLQNIVQYDASNNITLPARLAVTGTVAVNNTTPYDTTQFSLDVNGGLIVKNINKTAQFVLINSNPATGGNNAFVVHTVGGTSGSSYADIQGYYGTSVAGSTVIRLNPQGGNVLVGSLAGTGTRVVVASSTGVLSTQAAQTIGDLNGVPTSRILTINGTSYDLSADRSWSITSMIYPGAGIAVSTGSAWGTSLTDNSSNWNTAYGWGNHAGLYSLLNHTHTFASLTSKPTTLVGYGITDAATSAQGTSADTAYGWGNHAIAGYLTGITSGQVTTALGFTPYNATNPSGYITTAALSTYATESYVGTQIANLVASSPAALDTLNELAAALGNDAAFSTTVSTALGNRLRVDTASQGLSATLQGYGRTNLGLGTAATANTGDFVAYRTFGTAANSATGDFVAYRTFGTAANNNTGDFAAASHTHSIANVTGLQTALDGKQASGSYAAATHSHIISDVTGLQTALDGKQASLGFTPYNSTNPSGYITSSGSISGNAATSTIFNNGSLYISVTNGNTLNSGYNNAGDGSDIWINYRGYNDAQSYFRDFRVGDGKGAQVALFTGSNKSLAITGAISASNLSGTNTGDQTSVSGNAGSITHNASRTDAAWYNVGWFTGASSPAYSSDAVNIQSSTGTLRATILSASSTNGIVNQENGTSTAWRGRILSKNSSSDLASFLGTYASIAGVFAHNNALDNWADLYVNTINGTSGGSVRLPSTTYINGSQAIHAGNFNSYSPGLTGASASGTWGINITGESHGIANNGNAISGMGPISTWDSRPGVGMAGFGISWHTGVSISGYPGYGGVRLYSAGYPTHASSVLRLEASDSVKTFGGLYSDGNPVLVQNTSISYSFGLNDNKLYLRTNGDNNHYLWNNASDFEEMVYYNGTGFKVTSSTGVSTCVFESVASSGMLFIGSADASRTYIGDASRSGIAIGGTAYPQLMLNAVGGGNTTHGANISMTGLKSAGGYRRWVMGIPNLDPTTFSLGWADDQSNPHYGVGVGWGASAAKFSWDTSGNFIASGDITAYGTPSDLRLKDLKGKVSNALSSIIKLNGYRFDWKEDKSKLFVLKEDIGVIAQEVADVFPELARTNEDGFMSVRYQGLTAVLIEAVKEQQTQIESQKSEIDELKDLVKQLINR